MPPDRPKIYHITHLENLPQMIDRVIWSDSERIRQNLGCKIVGMSEIKRRRLEELLVSCHAGTFVGQYVPFYFCPRSVMLYLLYQGNHADLAYREGQVPIVHLESDLQAVVAWAQVNGRQWAFSKGNAGARYGSFFNDLARLCKLDWAAIEATNWRDPFVKEGKQAEFLMFESFPWSLVERIGVIDDTRAGAVRAVINQARYQPPVAAMRNWYY